MLQIVTRATTVISPGLSVTKVAIIPIVTITMLIHTMLFSITVITTLLIILTSIVYIVQVNNTAPLIRQPPATMQRVTTIAIITTTSGAIPTPYTIILVAPTTHPVINLHTIPRATIIPPINQAPATTPVTPTILTNK